MRLKQGIFKSLFDFSKYVAAKKASPFLRNSPNFQLLLVQKISGYTCKSSN